MIEVHVQGWVLEKLHDGVAIESYERIGEDFRKPYLNTNFYNYRVEVRPPKNVKPEDYFWEMVYNLKKQQLYPEPKTKSVMKTVNKEAYEKRIDEQVQYCSNAIEVSWSLGKPKLTLEVDTDIYHKVKDKLFQEFTELTFTRIGVTEGWTSNTKKGTTKFAITNKNYA